jgi:uncharacterized protein (DUF169 family)
MIISADSLGALTNVGFTTSPVAMAFLAAPPAGLDRISRSDPAGCGYWKQAAEGRAFYTTPDDHVNCPTGAYTHGVSLSAALGAELQSIVGTMIELKYIKSEEVAALPRRTEPLQVVAYAPLSEATFAPDVVIFRGNVRQIMLLAEAAKAAGVFEDGSVMGRPACAMVPQAISASVGVASVGCIGNRVYTGIDDGDLYAAVPGKDIARIADAAEVIASANAAMLNYHNERRRQLATG